MASTTVSPRPATARRTTIALKILMAVTGIVFIGYLLLHMYGNLKLLAGEESFNTYAHHLRTFGEPMLPYEGLLWIIRIVLIVSIIGHAYAAFTLWNRAGNARKVQYAKKPRVWSSTWMRWGGVFILLFIVWHLIHFTIGKVSPNAAKQGLEITQNPYQLVVASFELWWMTLIYILALLALGLHISHGAYSAQQTLGWTNTAGARSRAKGIGHALAALVVVGFIIPPLGVLFGLIK